jgi:biopolymer transport protein ExbB
MNTFASLAESSEANLAAIAPGVASALACTLAGLMVAIPALYAYSYLTGRMRDLNADVKMFIDAFIFMLEKRKSDAL